MLTRKDMAQVKNKITSVGTRLSSRPISTVFKKTKISVLISKALGLRLLGEQQDHKCSKESCLPALQGACFPALLHVNQTETQSCGLCLALPLQPSVKTSIGQSGS